MILTHSQSVVIRSWVIHSHVIWLMRRECRGIFCKPAKPSWYVGKLRRKLLWYGHYRNMGDILLGSKVKLALLNRYPGLKWWLGWFRKKKLIKKAQKQNYLISSYCPTLSRGEVLYSYHENVALMKRYFVLIVQDLSWAIWPRQSKPSSSSEYQREG